MRRYAGTLREWRRQEGVARPLPQLLSLYAQALEAVELLDKNRVIHFDLKADNFLLETPSATPQPQQPRPRALCRRWHTK